MLMAPLLTVTGAAPTPPPSRAPLNTRGCHLTQYKSLSPGELQAFKKAQDALERTPLLKTWRCSSPLFPLSWDLRHLQVWERPVALEAELALTLKVLETVDKSALGTLLDQPLHTLSHIRSELLACTPAQPTAGPQARGRLHRWLHRLQEAEKKESRSCLAVSVTSNLFRLLTRDLKCVASGDQCV
ncbi:interferon lambda-3 [Echinops telfairi]|uniref:Interferon lambda-3 n=1 Tax=Echinops telfairi TaxID=9371 RepID=A0ABM0IXX1_ECHTE|nr:interferon lambda-3 [Echinops telfairi]